MFWNKKKKLPITPEDKKWLDSDLNWLQQQFGLEHFMEIQTVTPTKDFFDRNFDGTEKDAEFILERAIDLMKITHSNLKLQYFSDSPIEMDDGSLLTTPGDIDGKWSSAAGTYQETDDHTIISLETSQLQDTTSLVATIAHELAHVILLGERRIEENDELLTDLTAIVYGFGIFIGNARFSFSTFSTPEGSGW